MGQVPYLKEEEKFQHTQKPLNLWGQEWTSEPQREAQ